MSRAGAPPVRCVRVRVRGTVQGVGFRPHVHRLATELGLAGEVSNDADGVVIEAEGDGAALSEFLRRLAAEAPPLAVVEAVESEPAEPRGAAGFRIAESAAGVPTSPRVTADAAPCPDCLAELFDPSDRRHRYPFVNCTACGPRFTIVRSVPYDRPNTTMAAFAMCARCRAEYEDPGDRRFHAEPIACPACGPRVRLADRSGAELDPRDVAAEAGHAEAPADAVHAAALALRAGRIVAVKGAGGYQLACRADDADAVRRLRDRKRREEKPLAVMVRDADEAAGLALLSAADRELIGSRARPILVVPRAAGAQRLAPEIAPRSADVGLMLPSTPLHELLTADAGVPLVMTSGNLSDEPIAHRDADAFERLGPVADLFLAHDREIATRCDDSVARPPVLIRRARGYVPAASPLPHEVPPLLACGAELKSTFCLASGRSAWVGHHIGDLSDHPTLTAFREGVAHFQRLLGIEPEVVAHDMHPDYLSTAYALEREGVETVAVQHHHAHLAACLAEHGETGPAIGAIYDGTGYGTDGTIWGGEILAGGLEDFERVGHLSAVPLPGGATAVREPWRMACAWLAAAEGDQPALPPALAGEVEAESWEQVAALLRSAVPTPLTTSTGRLFDAVAALCGLRARVRYEGQAAAELEGVADRAEPSAYPLAPAPGERGAAVIDPRELIAAVARDAADGIPAGTISARFHNALATATATAVAEQAGARSIGTAVLSGGVFQNRLLLERTSKALEGSGLRVLVPERLPPNDGGISYGQAAVAAAGLRRGPRTRGRT